MTNLRSLALDFFSISTLKNTHTHKKRGIIGNFDTGNDPQVK